MSKRNPFSEFNLYDKVKITLLNDSDEEEVVYATITDISFPNKKIFFETKTDQYECNFREIVDIELNKGIEKFKENDRVKVTFEEDGVITTQKAVVEEISLKNKTIVLKIGNDGYELSFDEVMEIEEDGNKEDIEFENLGMENYSFYKEYTETANWRAISLLNKRPLDSFLTRKELKVLPQYLEEDEVVFATSSGLIGQSFTSNYSDSGNNSWLVVLTNKRFLFLDHAFWTGAVDTQSVLHEKVQAVSASQGFFLGKLIIDIASRPIVIDHCQNGDVKVIAELANKWYSVLKKKEKAEKAASHNLIQRQYSSKGNSSKESIADELEKLAKLKKSGILSASEFQTAKKKLLKKL